MNLSEKIFKLRKTNGLSQDELAEKLNVSRQAISKWETDQATPELDKIVKLAELFNVTTDYLLQHDIADELAIRTTALEKQQQEILNKQRKNQKRQYLILSIVISIIAIFIFFLVGHYLRFSVNGVGSDFEQLGKYIILGGTLVTLAIAIILNWRYRVKM